MSVSDIGFVKKNLNKNLAQIYLVSHTIEVSLSALLLMSILCDFLKRTVCQVYH